MTCHRKRQRARLAPGPLREVAIDLSSPEWAALLQKCQQPAFGFASGIVIAGDPGEFGVGPMGETGWNHQGQTLDDRAVCGLAHPTGKLELGRSQYRLVFHQFEHRFGLGDIGLLEQAQHDPLDALRTEGDDDEMSRPQMIRQVGGEMVVKAAPDRWQVDCDFGEHRWSQAPRPASSEAVGLRLRRTWAMRKPSI